MAYNEELVRRIGDVLTDRSDTQEKKMFGGVAFMVGGHMCCGVVDDTLMVRIGPEKYDEALGKPHVRPMDFTGKPMKGYIYVDPDGLASKTDLKKWIGLGVAFVSTLPPKKAK